MPAISTPYTFAASTRSRPGPVFVQVQISKVSHCARVREGWIANDGAFLWALDLLFPFRGRASFPEMRVRSCSGVDGRCLCAGEDYPIGDSAKPGAGSSDRASGAPHEAELLSEKEVTCL